MSASPMFTTPSPLTSPHADTPAHMRVGAGRLTSAATQRPRAAMFVSEDNTRVTPVPRAPSSHKDVLPVNERCTSRARPLRARRRTGGDSARREVDAVEACRRAREDLPPHRLGDAGHLLQALLHRPR